MHTTSQCNIKRLSFQQSTVLHTVLEDDSSSGEHRQHKPPVRRIRGAVSIIFSLSLRQTPQLLLGSVHCGDERDGRDASLKEGGQVRLRDLPHRGRRRVEVAHLSHHLRRHRGIVAAHRHHRRRRSIVAAHRHHRRRRGIVGATPRHHRRRRGSMVAASHRHHRRRRGSIVAAAAHRHHRRRRGSVAAAHRHHRRRGGKVECVSGARAAKGGGHRRGRGCHEIVLATRRGSEIVDVSVEDLLDNSDTLIDEGGVLHLQRAALVKAREMLEAIRLGLLESHALAVGGERCLNEGADLGECFVEITLLLGDLVDAIHHAPVGELDCAVGGAWIEH